MAQPLIWVFDMSSLSEIHWYQATLKYFLFPIFLMGKMTANWSFKILFCFFPHPCFVYYGFSSNSKSKIHIIAGIKVGWTVNQKQCFT